MAITITAGYTFAAAEKVTPTKLNTAQTGLVITQATNRLIGRTTASSGSIEEITPGAGLDFSSLGLSVGWLDTNSSHRLRIACGSDLSADRTLTITTGDAARTLTLTGNATLNQDVSTAGSPTFTGGTFSGTGTIPVSITTTNAISQVSQDTTAGGASDATQYSFRRNGTAKWVIGNNVDGGSSDNFGIRDSGGTVRLAVTSTGLSATGTLGASSNVWSGNNAFALGSGTTDGFYATAGGSVVASANAGPTLQARRRASDGDIVTFWRDTTNVGSISVTTTSTAYNTSSDMRLKTDKGAFLYADVAAPIYALCSIMRKYAWDVWLASPDEATRNRVAYGWFAQEAETVAPWMVNHDAASDRYSINPMALIPNIVAALGVHKTELDALKARVALLEAA